MIEHIAIQSAGNFTWRPHALMMRAFQLISHFSQAILSWYLWGSHPVFRRHAYAAGVFFRIQPAAGPANRCGGLLEFTPRFLVHGLYGLSFSYLK
jgi:hypothetical protein